MIDAKVNMNVLYVKGCLPHYRRPLAEIMRLRRDIAESLTEKGVALPLTEEIHLRVLARRHQDGGDLSNILHAVCQAIDGSTLDQSVKILINDGQVMTISARWIP